MVRGVSMLGGQWSANVLALAGVWLTLRNIVHVYREHREEDFVFAGEWWKYADLWWSDARELCGLEQLELRRWCVRNALRCEERAAMWFVKGCGG